MKREETLQDRLPRYERIAKKLADKREKMHENDSSHRPLSKDYEAVGIFGQLCTGFEFGWKIDRELRRRGDDCAAFITEAGTVQVKAARLAYNLPIPVKQIKRAGDFIILVQFNGFKKPATLIGWATRKEMLKAEKRTFNGHKILNHTKPARQLRNIDSLHDVKGIHKQIFRED